MVNEIIPYIEMCRREGASLQRGMNFAFKGTHSVILMSLRRNAPYADRLEDDGSTLIYEGHNVPRTDRSLDPKSVDQPEHTPTGRLTQNGLFHQAAHAHKTGRKPPERVRVYEKIHTGIWSYNGVFHLVDSWRESHGKRMVFKFKLVAVEGEENMELPASPMAGRRRIIPTSVKLGVWKRDQGRCVVCGATDELHFDHDIPFSLGGASVVPENVQLLCARHNLEKRNDIR